VNFGSLEIGLCQLYAVDYIDQGQKPPECIQLHLKSAGMEDGMPARRKALVAVLMLTAAFRATSGALASIVGSSGTIGC
jgi:hypothetical protein